MTLIDKEALLEKLSTFHPDYTFNITSFRNFIKAQPEVDAVPVIRCKDCIKREICRTSTTQPERKKGRWEMKPDPYGFFGEIPVCSECGCTTKMRDKTKFCPHCGARMEESDG